MAKTITAAFLALASLLCRAQVSETRATGNFSKIEVASGIGLAYSESSEVSVLAEAATQESLEGIVTEVKGKTLRIYYAAAGPIPAEGSLKVYVGAQGVDSFEASSKARVSFKNPVQSQEIAITVSSGASFLGTLAKNSRAVLRAGSGATLCCRVDTGRLEGRFEGAATAVLSGTADISHLSARSRATCLAKNLDCARTTVSASEHSSVLIHGAGTINADAETGATVSYFGKPAEIILGPTSFPISKIDHHGYILTGSNVKK